MAPRIPPEDVANQGGIGARVSVVLREFLATEIAGGAFLLAATVVAILWAATAFHSYDAIWNSDLFGHAAPWGLPGTPRAAINEGLMTIFFFVVGLEVKRELTHGELSDRRRALVPILAALGGILFPAAIYLALTRDGAVGHGWAIPMATDIAFALGVLSLFGRNLPTGVRVFLLTLAVVDDIATLVVITLFYSTGVAWSYLLAAVLVLILASVVGHRFRAPLLLYLALAAPLWWLTLRSGIPPTTAGVGLALALPADLPAERAEHALHPWSSFFVVPLFALANAGLPLTLAGIRATASSQVAIAVIVARVAGKFLGVSLGAWIAVRMVRARLPEGVDWSHVLAVGCVASVGFTVPLFVTTLAFGSSSLADAAKLAILLATVSGFVIGGLALRLAAGRKAPQHPG